MLPPTSQTSNHAGPPSPCDGPSPASVPLSMLASRLRRTHEPDRRPRKQAALVIHLHLLTFLT